jgi:uncharacterized protein YbaP (TraB family)
VVSAAFAQEKKYQGLLWQVSGNGLKKNSYLYGSMHVSDKVSYHLSDAFFTHLLGADIIANESEPSTWMDLMGIMGPKSSYGNEFYNGFYLKPAKKEDLFPLFRSSNFTLNNLLFRTNEYQKEYQEETYLDMFIYRTGRKYNKKTVGLEDTKTSLVNVSNIDYKESKPKEENIAAIKKLLKNNGYEEAMMNFYRDKDLDMLDSLTTLSSSESYLKALLYDRNVVMVHSIDSLVKTGSLFAAVGAAHLPGKRGIIEMLRSKGYTVTPVTDTYSDKGKAKKEEIEDYFIKPAFSKYTTPDGMVTLPLFSNAVIENREDVQSPDLANGGYINIKRLLLNDFLNKNNKPFNPKTIDSLFYENIPGKILDKKFYTQDGYTVYDIKSITKTGNAQHYRYYISPLEVIAISMAGEGNYVRQFENEVYSGISIKPVTTPFTSFSPAKGSFSVSLPGYAAVYGQSVKSKTPQDTRLYAYDTTEKANYFVIERTLTDNSELEDTDFELKRMQYEFYTQMDIDSTNGVTDPLKSYTSSSKIGSKDIRLKSVIIGAKYYLLGCVGASQTNSDRFLESFTEKSAVYTPEYREYTNKDAAYSITIPKKENERLDFMRSAGNDDAFEDPEEKNDLFREKYQNYSYTLPSGQDIDVYYHRYHRYENEKNIDTLWTNFRKYMTNFEEVTEDDDENNVAVVEEISPEAYDEYGNEASTFLSDKKTGITPSLWAKLTTRKKSRITLVNEKTSYNKEGNYYQMEGTAVSDKSSQAIKFKAIYHNGTSYLISLLTDRNYKGTDPSIEKAFSSFKPLQNNDTLTLHQDRLQLFIADANSEHDSIRSSALNSAYRLEITKENAPVLERFIEGFDFTKSKSEALNSLYTKLGAIKDESIIPFLDRQYKLENAGTSTQFAVLEALAQQKSGKAYKKILELMEYDLPVSGNRYIITSLFKDFEADPKNSSVLFPDIVQFYSIPEYHEPIINLAATLIDKKAIKPGALKSYKKMILTNARLELKRTKSRIADSEDEEEYYARPQNPTALIGYLDLLYPFRNDKDVKPVMAAAKKMGQQDVTLELARLNIVNSHSDQEELKALLSDPKTLFPVQNMLITQKQNGLLKTVTDEQTAQSAIIVLNNIDTKTNALSLITKKTATVNKQKVTFYFFRIKHTGESDGDYRSKTDRMAGVAFVNNEDRINPLAYNNTAVFPISDEEETDKIIKALIDATITAGRNRVGFGDMDDYSYPELEESDY